MKNYLHEIFFPYVKGVRASIGLEDDYPALAIFDNFKGQETGEIMELLEEHNVHVVKHEAASKLHQSPSTNGYQC